MRERETKTDLDECQQVERRERTWSEALDLGTMVKRIEFSCSDLTKIGLIYNGQMNEIYYTNVSKVVVRSFFLVNFMIRPVSTRIHIRSPRTWPPFSI